MGRWCTVPDVGDPIFATAAGEGTVVGGEFGKEEAAGGDDGEVTAVATLLHAGPGGSQDGCSS